MLIIYCLFFIKVLSFEYYGSQNVLTWSDAENYCNTHCNSSLISINSSTENTELQTFCNIMNNNEAEDCWIGFNDIAVENTWIWIDETAVDYGSDISGGVLPWGLGEPDNYQGNQDCVQLRASGHPSYSWDDDFCILYKHLLCNKCYPTLSKYILVNKTCNQSTANQYCRDAFGTELATIQSESDYQEAKLLCNYSGDDCWIGLHDYNTEGSWEWEDGTQNIDFWTNSSGEVSGYPWNTGEPNNFEEENCVELFAKVEYFVNDRSCDKSIKFLCNSALDNYICDINVQRELWSDLSCEWIWNEKSDGCGVTSSDLFTDCVTWLGNNSDLEPYKSWSDLVVEVTFSMATIPGNSGILIRAQKVSPINDGGQQYYIGMYIVSNIILLGKMNDGFTILSTTNLNFTSIVDRYYTVRCELFGDLFNIYVDNVLYITHYDSSYAHGSVGLRSFNQTVTYKKLFISGVEFEFEPTVQPTSFPTNQPTIRPTIFPTSLPTMYPTKIPSTMQPTFEPSVNPSFNPSYIPTVDPTADPSLFSSRNPSEFPSYFPTNEPTIYPSLPSMDPSSNPNEFTVNAISEELFSNEFLLIAGMTVFVIIICLVLAFLCFKMFERRKRNALLQISNATAVNAGILKVMEKEMVSVKYDVQQMEVKKYINKKSNYNPHKITLGSKSLPVIYPTPGFMSDEALAIDRNQITKGNTINIHSETDLDVDLIVIDESESSENTNIGHSETLK